jgi:hypothetical protein
MFNFSSKKLQSILERKYLKKQEFNFKKERPLVKISKLKFYFDNKYRKNTIVEITDGNKEIEIILNSSVKIFALKVGSIVTINSIRHLKRSIDIRLRTKVRFEVTSMSLIGFQGTDEDIQQSYYDFDNLKELPTHTTQQLDPSLSNKCWSLEVEVLDKTSPKNVYGPISMYLSLRDSSGLIRAKVVGEDNVKRFKRLKLNHKYIIRNAECPCKDKYLEDIDILCNKQTHFVPSKNSLKKTDKLLYKFKNNPKLLKFYVNDNEYDNNKKFCMLNQLPEKEISSNVYVEAIIEQVGELFTTKNQLVMRNICIVDMSGIQVNVTLWEEQAKKFNFRPGTMLLFIDALVNKFNDRYSLVVTKRTGMVEMEDFDGFKSCDRLRYWWVNSWWPYRRFRKNFNL